MNMELTETSTHEEQQDLDTRPDDQRGVALETFLRLWPRLQAHQQRELIDTLEYMLWFQNWRQGNKAVPGAAVLRGAVLDATFDVRIRLSRAAARIARARARQTSQPR